MRVFINTWKDLLGPHSRAFWYRTQGTQYNTLVPKRCVSVVWTWEDIFKEGPNFKKHNKKDNNLKKIRKVQHRVKSFYYRGLELPMQYG